MEVLITARATYLVLNFIFCWKCLKWQKLFQRMNSKWLKSTRDEFGVPFSLKNSYETSTFSRDARIFHKNKVLQLNLFFLKTAGFCTESLNRKSKCWNCSAFWRRLLLFLQFFQRDDGKIREPWKVSFPYGAFWWLSECQRGWANGFSYL